MSTERPFRQRQFPTGCGKAYDVALICKWMANKLDAMASTSVP